MAVDYNSSEGTKISIDPQEIWNSHLTLDFHQQTITDELTAIGKHWQEIQIQWEGPDATSAQDFVNQLTAAMTALFGPPNATKFSDLGPEQGSLVKLAVGVSMTALNYDGSETQVRKMMVDFSDRLGGGSGAGDTTDVITAGPLTEYKNPK